MAPASSAKLVKSFWNWQIFFQLKPCRAKPNTCWQSEVQTGICFRDQSNAIYFFFFFLKENKKRTVKVLKKKTKLSYSCVWISVLGLSIQCYSPSWIISESSCLVWGLYPFWGTSQTNLRWILTHSSKPNFPANWFSLDYLPPLDSEMCYPSLHTGKEGECFQREYRFIIIYMYERKTHHMATYCE